MAIIACPSCQGSEKSAPRFVRQTAIGHTGGSALRCVRVCLEEAGDGDESGRPLTLDCECRAPIAPGVPGDPRAGVVLSRGNARRNLNHKGAPNTLAPLAGLRSFGRHFAGFSEEDMADTHSRRPGRLCYLRS